jgi:hypothetical protein
MPNCGHSKPVRIRAALDGGMRFVLILITGMLITSCACPAEGTWWLQVYSLMGDTGEISAKIPFVVERDGTFSGDGFLSVKRKIFFPSQTNLTRWCEETWLLPNHVVMRGRYIGESFRLFPARSTPTSASYIPRSGFDIDSITIDPINEATNVTIKIYCDGQQTADAQGETEWQFTLSDFSNEEGLLGIFVNLLMLFPDLVSATWAQKELYENKYYKDIYSGFGYDMRIEIGAYDGATSEVDNIHLQLHTGLIIGLTQAD